MARTRSAVPTGTVDLMTIVWGPVMASPIILATPDRQVSGTVRIARCTHRDVGHLGLAHCTRPIRRKPEPTFPYISVDEVVQAWLKDRNNPLFEALDLALVIVDTDHGMAQVRQTGPSNKPDIAGTHNTDLHFCPLGN